MALGIGIGIGIGWPLGGPSVAQEPPKRDARIKWKKCFVCNKRQRKAGRGRFLPLICADGR
jgi:hypothetical protein